MERTLPLGAPWPGPAPGARRAGHALGAYRLARRLGEGGMGEVWLAEQTAPVRRWVALKLIKAGMDTRRVVARFEAERQALALMEHPAIAKVLDAGTTPDGRPYFAMEHVEGGVPLDAYCDRERLALRGRLALFAQVCDGVQHAHQKAVIHRDLKPSNVLVTTIDGRPAPKIIDFGIAKAIAQPLTEAAPSTELGALVGTPEYMSPEQADPLCPDVDTRADVYALGVMLYELLCGSLPLAARELRAASLEELRRTLREVDPPPPSARLAPGDQGASAAARRGTAPDALARALRGDLDAIAMKALEKERARRYGTPAELAADVRRWLAGEPVLARPASAAYRLGKYARRHRAGVAVGAAAALVLPAFTVALAVQVRRVSAERDRANHEAETSRRVADFMTGMFRLADPSEARGNSVTAREVLDKATADIGAALAGDPALQARMMETMGSVYTNLALYPRAHALLEEALALRRRVLGPDARETLATRSELGALLGLEGRYDEAEPLLREVVEQQRRALGAERAETLDSMRRHATALRFQGKYPEAEALQRAALDAQRRVLGMEQPSTLLSMTNLAGILIAQNRWPEAEALDRETLTAAERALGPDDPITLRALQDLAGATSMVGRPAEAEQLTREVIERERRVLGPEHDVTLRALYNLADVLLSEERLAEAEAMGRQALLLRRRVLGGRHPDTLESMEQLALILKHQRRYREAGALLGEVVLLKEHTLGAAHPRTATARYNLACNLALWGRGDEALAQLRGAVENGLHPSILPTIEHDDDLASLRGDPRFAAIVAEARRRAADGGFSGPVYPMMRAAGPRPPPTAPARAAP